MEEKDEKRCSCPCHREAGFFHCFSVCCDQPDMVCDPPPIIRPIVIGEFKKITFPQVKKVFPGLLVDDITGTREKKDDSE